jgi:hypothetical protein
MHADGASFRRQACARLASSRIRYRVVRACSTHLSLGLPCFRAQILAAAWYGSSGTGHFMESEIGPGRYSTAQVEIANSRRLKTTQNRDPSMPKTGQRHIIVTPLLGQSLSCK